MATLAELDTAYRRRQVVLQGAVGLIVQRGFNRLTPEDIINESPAVGDWLDRSTALSLSLHSRSAREATAYYDSVRALVTPGAAPFRHPETDPLPVEQVRTSLFVTGVVGARKQIETARSAREPAIVVREADQAMTLADVDTLRRRQLDLLRQERTGQIEQAIPVSANRAAAAAARHVANGGREQVQASSKADPRAVGWVRVTSSDPCYFCALLASRPPVYKEDSFDASDALFDGPGRHKVHDNCSCSMRPIYSKGTAEVPQLNLQLAERWRQLSESEDIDVLDINAWRRHYEGRA